MQKLKYTFAAAIMAIGASGTNVANAADTYKPAFKPAPAQSLVKPVRYCAAWYRECRIRWGYGWRFRRCMAIRNCI